VTVTKRVSGIFIDERGRYSLTHLQTAPWTLTILSLLSGMFFGRLAHGVPDPLSTDIPPTVLGLLGISAGSGVAATAVKRTKDVTQPASVAVTNAENSPRLNQIFPVEEGTFPNQVADITKFQGFVVTIPLIVAYIAASVNEITTAGTALGVASLANINSAFGGPLWHQPPRPRRRKDPGLRRKPGTKHARPPCARVNNIEPGRSRGSHAYRHFR
jgi:hypothetical protein